MNKTGAEIAHRRTILIMWWLKARRAASGQNTAAAKYKNLDSVVTALNIAFPLIVFALGLCSSVANRLNASLSVSFTDVLAVTTAVAMSASFYQMRAEFGVKALQHKHASCEFDALGQELEATGFEIVDDMKFLGLTSKFEEIKRASLHVPERYWRRAKKIYDPLLKEYREKLLNSVEQRHVP